MSFVFIATDGSEMGVGADLHELFTTIVERTEEYVDGDEFFDPVDGLAYEVVPLCEEPHWNDSPAIQATFRVSVWAVLSDGEWGEYASWDVARLE